MSHDSIFLFSPRFYSVIVAPNQPIAFAKRQKEIVKFKFILHFDRLSGLSSRERGTASVGLKDVSIAELRKATSGGGKGENKRHTKEKKSILSGEKASKASE